MTWLLLIPLYFGTALLAWCITDRIRRYAVKRAILDYPNQRSSHSQPIPRGGGISIAVIVLSCLLVLWLAGEIPRRVLLAAGAGGILVTLVGWLDDKKDLPAAWRAASYLLASGWAVYWLFPLYATEIQCLVLAGSAVLALAWLTNLYNFMDGSDGMAAAQAIFTALVTALMLWPENHTGLSVLLLVLSAACAGFLIWNLPPARIFLGDTGSCLIGFLLAVLALFTSLEGKLPPAVWLILLSIFICDASLTLGKRVLKGEKWYRAHRSHAYQVLLQSGLTHGRLLSGVVIVNLLLLIPLSCLSYNFPDYQWWITAAVYLLMASVWLTIQLNWVKQKRLSL